MQRWKSFFPFDDGLYFRSGELEVRDEVLGLLAQAVVLSLQLLCVQETLLHSLLGVVNILNVIFIYMKRLHSWTLTRLRVCFLSCVMVLLKVRQSDSNLLDPSRYFDCHNSILLALAFIVLIITSTLSYHIILLELPYHNVIHTQGKRANFGTLTGP